MKIHASYKLFSFLLLLLLGISCERDNTIVEVIGGDCHSKLVTNLHDIEGYTSRESYAPGDTIQFMVHTPEAIFDLELTRHGLNNTILHTETGIAGESQAYPECAFMSGCKWNVSWEFVIPTSWDSGMYSARITDMSGTFFYIVFVVKADPNQPPADIVVIASTNTWQAYNNWGGTSFYRLEDHDYSSSLINFQRPNVSAKPYGDDGHLANAELHVLRWLEDKGYSYELVADRDIHENPEILRNYKAMVINTHGEYWTEEMVNGVIEYLKDGGNIAYLSGNGAYWRTTFKDQEIEVQKTNGNHLHDGKIGGKWRDVGIAESRYLGVRYDTRGYDTYAPYLVLNAEHWIFDGTNLQNGDSIGEYSLNRGAASGHETDKIADDSPSNLIHLAKGLNPDDGGADMTYFVHSGGGGVFSVGSVTYGGSLSVDADISKLTQNVIDHFITQ